jgi:hypothetical protein
MNRACNTNYNENSYEKNPQLFLNLFCEMLFIDRPTYLEIKVNTFINYF